VNQVTKKKEEKEIKPEEASETVPKKTKKKGVFIGSTILVLLVAGVVLYLVGNNMNAPEKKIAAFTDAVENNEVDALQGLLTSSDETFEINSENTAELLTYLNANPGLLQELEEKFTTQAEENETGNEAYASINLVTDGKNMLFFDDYQFEVTPGYIHPMANGEAIEFFINEEPAEDVATYTDKGYGPFMPGRYQIDAVFDNSFVSLEDRTEVELYDSPIEEVVYSFDFPVDDITAHSNYDEYVLYVNGEKTDVMIQEGEQNIGEFPNDESVSLFIGKDFPWGEVRSEEVVITEENEVEFLVEHALSEDARTDLMEQMNSTIALYQEALTERDASLLDEGVTDELIEALEEHIEDIEENDPEYEGSLVGAIYDGEHISNPEFDEDLNAYTVTMRVQHIFHEPNGNLGWMFRDTDADEYTRSRELTVIFNEEIGEWELHDNSNRYFVIPSSREVEFEV
jgi:uncharacterized membrane protein YvbJ